MYLSKPERQEIISAYGFGIFEDINHYQVESDTYVYMFCDGGKKYVLISADYLDFHYDHFSHLLRFDNGEFTKTDFALQREVPVKNGPPEAKAAGTMLFEYTDQNLAKDSK